MKRILFVPMAALLVGACSTESSDSLITGLTSLNQVAPTIITAEKTAEGRLTETFPWTIEKASSVETLQMFRGDGAAARFTVTLERGESFNVNSVGGEVCVTNDGAAATEGLQIVDKVQFHTGDGNFQDLEDASVTLTPAEQVAAGTTECFPYDVPFEPQEGATYRNVALVTITNYTGNEGTPTGPETMADFTIAESLTGEAFRSVTVEDSRGPSWTFDDSGSETYDGVFVCDDDDGENTNVVTIVETGQTAEALVTVECFALEVAKTTETEFTRTYQWSITKTASTEQLLLPAGFPWDVAYTVSVDVPGYADGDAAVSGTITIVNPAPLDVTVTAVVDSVSPDLPMTVDCGVTFPTVLAAGTSLSCTYTGALPDVTERENEAIATIQNVETDAEGVATPTGTTGFADQVPVVFGDPANELDECVDVEDSQAGTLGTVCRGDGLPSTFSYDGTLGAYETCGTFSETNTASFVTSDTEATGEASWTVEVTVPCGPPCTLSHGYWKNHSSHGPAPFDETWSLLPDGADTPFFDTGETWLHFLREPPVGGNGYVKLARQYMAAWLSGLHGANVADVADDLQSAIELLDRYDGNPDAYDNDDRELREAFTSLAERLDDFVSGVFGPGECNDDDQDDGLDDGFSDGFLTKES